MSARSLNWLKFGGLVALAFALGLLFAGLLDLPHRSAAQQAGLVRPAIAPVEAPSIPQARPLQDLSDAFAAVADAVRPSVVYVRSSRTEAPQTPRNIPRGMERFFPRERGPRFEQGSGSGFVVSADGYILTNNHVVAGAERVTVRLLDRREFTARVVGTDPNTDVAVLKIDATALTPLALGNSDNEKVGEWVLAIGNPLGENLTFTVTSGIISAKGRRLDGLGGSSLNISDFIQTDAAINPGNSGGPLVNVRGEVIGINSAIASETGFYSGYGFAIPINLVRNVMNQLIATGRVQRAAMVVNIEDADRNDAEYVGLDQIRGVKVVAIPSETSPARQAGIVPGDVIVAIDGKPVTTTSQLQQEIGFRKPGDVVRVEVARKGGERKTFSVRLEALNDTTEVAEADEPGSPDADKAEPAASTGAAVNLLGARVQPVTPAVAQELGIPASNRGLLIADVTPGGPAWEANLRGAGQGVAYVIQSVEGKPVRTDAELRSALESVGPGKIASLGLSQLVVSQGGTNVTTVVERVRLGTR